ncbi:acyltransferase family protein [Flavobacterium saliperosum]|uniref:Peptidoglycan/LPS O-acetylase OafA/YrhL, contains acyltransferase and SGNH-hydrolase domains n=2 Tax=Flavobacterium saliperosum TaxID=329186 RepID=A0A1G4V652_9FLAO|nr:acyltransferase [Flavobacterium saliperosum]SCX00875.1 Peptidoglycan/LPS O-acetylase OafA/YrhL, contains acyltransferase and SGNH-hydrolase domains [Flavobacterium saliperosum]
MIDTSIKTDNRIFGLDVMRAVSIAMVLFSHSTVIYPENDGILSKLKDLSGFFGIELFFILSGFLVGSSIYKLFIYNEYGFGEVKNFLFRRMFRIIPSYYLVLIINIIIYICFAFSLREVWKYFFLMQNVATPIPAFFPESWSLPVKELGYVIAVLLLYVFVTFFSNFSRKKIFFSVIFSMLILSFLAKVNYHFHSDNVDLSVWSQSVRGVMIYRMDSVLAGLLLGCLFFEHPHFFKRNKLLFAGFGLLFFLLFLASVMIFKLRLDNAAWFWNIFCLPLASVIVLMLFPMMLDWKKGPKRLVTPVKFACDISYSVYLIHYSIVLFLMMRLFDLKSYSQSELHIFTLSYLTVTLLLSVVFYHFFEKPINKYRLSNFKLRLINFGKK